MPKLLPLELLISFEEDFSSLKYRIYTRISLIWNAIILCINAIINLQNHEVQSGFLGDYVSQRLSYVLLVATKSKDRG